MTNEVEVKVETGIVNRKKGPGQKILFSLKQSNGLNDVHGIMSPFSSTRSHTDDLLTYLLTWEWNHSAGQEYLLEVSYVSSLNSESDSEWRKSHKRLWEGVGLCKRNQPRRWIHKDVVERVAGSIENSER